MARLNFLERNKDYIKYSDVPQGLISKYKDIVPDELINIWENYGFGIYEDGYLQIINPEEWEFVFEYIDILLTPTVVFGITALGDILLWEGTGGQTVAKDEGNRVKFINIRSLKSRASTKLESVLKNFIGEEYFLLDKEYFDAKPYLDKKDDLPKLEYGQCYGYVPALALGGKKSNKNLQIVDAKSYIDIIGQAVGKIYDLGD